MEVWHTSKKTEWERIKKQRFRALQKAQEERELNKRYFEDWSPSFHNQVKLLEDKIPERESRERRKKE